jgi:hypothetical protein
MSRVVYASYETEEQAASAIKALMNADFEPNGVSVLMRHGGKVEEVPVEERDRLGVGAAVGGAVGAALGAIGTTLVATGVLVAPGFALAAAGPVLAALEGAVAGGTTGAMVGWAAALGKWKTMAHFPHDELERGAIVVAISTEAAREEEACEILRGAGGSGVCAFAEQLKQVREALS